MNKRLLTGFLLGTLAFMFLAQSLILDNRVIVNHIITHEVVVTQSAIVFSDQERINIFVNELLTKKSAACFKRVLMKETHRFNVFARNPQTGATGVGQLLASTYYNLGFRKSNNAIAQTVASLAYISERYGSAGPCGAWKHELKFGWY